MLTVRCAPFTEAGESRAIKAAKWLEESALGFWRKSEGDMCPGQKPHERVPEVREGHGVIITATKKLKKKKLLVFFLFECSRVGKRVL